MIRFLIVIAISVSSSVSFAQDTGLQTKTKLLLIPNREDMFINENSAQYIQETGKNYTQIQDLIQSEIYKVLVNTLADTVHVDFLSGSTTITSIDPVEVVFEHINYHLSPCPDTTKGLKLNKRLIKKKNPADKKENQGQLVSVREDPTEKYVDVYFQDSKILTGIMRDFDADNAVIVSQIEIKADFSNQSHMIKGFQNWKIIIHYSIFNKGGVEVYGDKIIQPIPYDKADFNTLIKNHIPEISQKLERILISKL